MTDDRNIKIDNGNYIETIKGNYIQGNFYAIRIKKNLAEVAVEIKALLKQIEQNYPSKSTSHQMIVAAKAIEKIESNPVLKNKVINAVKESSLAALEQAIDNPTGAFIVNVIKGWQEAN